MHRFGLSAMVAGMVVFTAPAVLCLPATQAAESSASSKDQVDDSPPSSKPIPTIACQCALPKAPIYVEDWGRLADLTQYDPLVSAKASLWRDRHNASRWLLGGVILGAGAATLATFDRLGTGSWTDTNKWMLAGGLTAATLSMLAYWAFAPDRDDLLTVINHWNLRHPDRTLAP